jgi:Transcriptional regulators
MTTIKDVALAAGVSVATASNALNGKKGVRETTRQKVQVVAERLRYMPNSMAKGLVTGSFGAIGIVLSGPAPFNVLTNQSMLQMIQAVASTVTQEGYVVMLNMVDFDAESGLSSSLRSNKTCDGIILVDTRSSDTLIQEFLQSIAVPAVVTMRTCPNAECPSISVDNHECGYIAAKHLIEHGHRDIAYVGVLEGVRPAELRLEGCRDALRDNGLELNPAFCLPGDHYQDSGRTAAMQLLHLHGRRPTAVVAGNDLMALGVIEVLQREGVRVPEDVSIVGCDNIPNAHMLRVPLTSVAIPFEYMGKLAAENLIARIRNPQVRAGNVLLAPELRVRESVAVRSSA